MQSIAHWDNVTRRYGKIYAAKEVTLSLPPGQAIALVGHNGAGKTTLIKLMLGLIKPSSGQVRALGEDPSGQAGADVRRHLGFLSENVAFHGAMTATELMRFYCGLKRQPTDRNAELLDQVGLSHAANRRIATYSKGMRQRLGIAQALIGAPRLLLLDEPTSGLDPASRLEVFALIDRMREAGVTVLVSTHQLAEIEHHVDRIAVMHRGQLIADGVLDDLRTDAQAEVKFQLRLDPGHLDAIVNSLPAHAHHHSNEESSIEIVLPAHEKMPLLKSLLAHDYVRDIKIRDVGLPELYDRLISRYQEAA
ncbi:MAG TPA: ABC transporter ATP-binding protein [Paenalcaligenes sp.]|nr:ABC transporter ATP-binding protein [Paenalcaligenes sp.]